MIFVNFPKKKLSLPKLKLVQFASILKENHNLWKCDFGEFKTT